MTLLRATARTLLASYFVVNGVKAVRNPEPLVPVAEPVTDKLVPLVKQYAPGQVATYVPEDTVTLVRLNGAVQALGGVALASGKGRRLGASLLAVSLVPSSLARHPYWKETTPEGRAAEKAALLKSSSLLGGVLLAAQDTEGKPSLAWRAQQGTTQLTKRTKRLTRGGSSLAKGTKQLTKSAATLAEDTREVADSALAEGALLVGAVVAQSRRAQKRAGKKLAKARKVAEKQAEAAAKRNQQRRKEAKKRKKIAAREAAELAAVREREAAERMASRKREAAAQYAAEKRAQKQAAKISRNIQRGEN